MYISENCSVADFIRLFPLAKQHSEPKQKKKIPLRKRNRFKTTRKLFSCAVSDLRELDAIFGTDWDYIFNGTSVGFVLPPMTFRLNLTTINSFKTALSKDLEKSFLVESSDKSTFTTISITLFRSTLSRWGGYIPSSGEYQESDWRNELLDLQNLFSGVFAWN